jgi:hypothetical protein
MVSEEAAPGTYCIGGWVGPIGGLGIMQGENLLPLSGIEPRLLGRLGLKLVGLPSVLPRLRVLIRLYNFQYDVGNI